MKHIFQNIEASIKRGEKLLAVLIDPDKMELDSLANSMVKLNTSRATHVFVGGSTVDDFKTDDLIKALKGLTDLPVLIFPGDVSQLSSYADGLLFLSLVSGRNPEYLIGKQVEAVSILRAMDLEIIPTGYVLIENGKETAVERVTQTQPLSRNNIQHIVDTAKASELLGMSCIYLEAGSGAIEPISSTIIKAVKKELQIPLIVGGGISSKQQLDNAYDAGADLVVIGTAFEVDDAFFDDIKSPVSFGHFPKGEK
ncbi:putative glycerol-1-phosphate prenyltransferase [Gelidibacter algens]|jgi:putative glycerol-1-phosphate prenyltransferase|uniref:Geranylgeranylglyceryl phosphate synthase n=1 Tax=Gelidibacter algens TaxID=49280 RepID=A0A1A7QUB8_9FLAO|nr:geranylgeranylglyceryl/heptaprenylglyceryl phosphate synthase [Gelidibacter algens]OBX23620.1 geranylgeranylglyceryl/heptaprenylglyceryl phosphate synthase [Gelidibacter algens]RAJ18712.1 putative glycerol-1-phosphate prenyltransferase [Gelidibacter algens]